MKKNVIITISSDKGLCGGINSTSVKVSKALYRLTSGNFTSHLPWGFITIESRQLLSCYHFVNRTGERVKVCCIGRKGQGSTHSWLEEKYWAVCNWNPEKSAELYTGNIYMVVLALGSSLLEVILVFLFFFFIEIINSFWLTNYISMIVL